MTSSGGARVCTQVTGAADFLVASEQECFQQIRRLLSFLPPNCRELPPDRANEDPATDPSLNWS